MGSDRLTRHLLDVGEVTLAQINEARRTQEFFGGQIGSHLLKLGFIDEDALGEALSLVSGAPYASRDQLRVIDDDARAALSRSLVRRLEICPFEVDGGTLRVAMLNPRDAVAVAEIRSEWGRGVQTWVTCEYRLYQARERHFGLTGDRRRAVSLAPPDRRAGRRASDLPAAPSDDPAPERGDDELGLDGRPLDAEVTFEEHLFGHVPSAFEGQADDEGEAASPAPHDPWRGLEAALAEAPDARAIAEALLDFCKGSTRRGALFAVAKDGLRGIAGRGRGMETERLGSLVLPVEPSSIFDSALKSSDFFFGVVPPLPANLDLYSALGGRLPAMAMVLPIVVKGRTVALLYLDEDDRPMSHPDIPRMRRVAAKAGLAFEIHLLRSKLSKI